MTEYSFIKQDNTLQQIVETNFGPTKHLPKIKRTRNKVDSMETNSKNEPLKKRARRSQIDNVAPTQIDTEAPTKVPLQRRSKSWSNSSSRSSAAARSMSGSKASKGLRNSRASSDALSRSKQSK